MTNLNNWIAVTGGILSIISIIKSIRERKFALYNFGVIVLGITVIALTVWKNKQDTTTETNHKQAETIKDIKVNNLQDSVNKLISAQHEFERYLKEKPFNIIRDTLTNKPVQMTFNTNIRDIKGNLHIGPTN